MKPEVRISVLLKLLGDDLAGAVLKELPPDRVGEIRRELSELDEDGLDNEKVDDVLDELEQILRFVMVTVDNGPRGGSSSLPTHTAREFEPDEEEAPEDQFVPSGHIQRDLNRIPSGRLAAVLEHEHPAMSALVLQAMHMGHAGEVLEALTDENRDAVFREMQAGRTARREFLDRILQSTIERAALVNMKELQAQKAGAEKKLAELLRAMNRKSRFGLLERISQDDPDTAARIRDQLYSTQDILGMESRSVQKLLGRVDTATLAKVLKDAGSAMQDKIMANLSKRACAALKEEMEYSGQVEDEAKKEASLRIVRAIMEMDEKGEVAFDS